MLCSLVLMMWSVMPQFHRSGEYSLILLSVWNKAIQSVSGVVTLDISLLSDLLSV
jgi:hypothetical protein